MKERYTLITSPSIVTRLQEMSKAEDMTVSDFICHIFNSFKSTFDENNGDIGLKVARYRTLQTLIADRFLKNNDVVNKCVTYRYEQRSREAILFIKRTFDASDNQALLLALCAYWAEKNPIEAGDVVWKMEKIEELLR